MAESIDQLLYAPHLEFRRPSGFLLKVDHVGVGSHEILGIVGPNGSGKSTLLELLAGQLRPVNGSVCLGGVSLTSFSRRSLARRIGYLPQGVQESYPLTVYATAMQGRYPHLAPLERPGLNDHEVVKRALEQTDMLRLFDRRMDQLSGGEFRRALLASVMAQEPELLLLDEPTVGLDVQHAATLSGLLRDFAREGMGVIVVTHDLNSASLICHRLLLMREGSIRSSGCPEDVFTDKNLKETYGNSAVTVRHPLVDAPMVLPALDDSSCTHRPGGTRS